MNNTWVLQHLPNGLAPRVYRNTPLPACVSGGGGVVGNRQKVAPCVGGLSRNFRDSFERAQL